MRCNLNMGVSSGTLNWYSTINDNCLLRSENALFEKTFALCHAFTPHPVLHFKFIVKSYNYRKMARSHLKQNYGHN